MVEPSAGLPPPTDCAGLSLGAELGGVEDRRSVGFLAGLITGRARCPAPARLGPTPACHSDVPPPLTSPLGLPPPEPDPDPDRSRCPGRAPDPLPLPLFRSPSPSPLPFPVARRSPACCAAEAASDAAPAAAWRPRPRAWAAAASPRLAAAPARSPASAAASAAASSASAVAGITRRLGVGQIFQPLGQLGEFLGRCLTAEPGRRRLELLGRAAVGSSPSGRRPRLSSRPCGRRLGREAVVRHEAASSPSAACSSSARGLVQGLGLVGAARPARGVARSPQPPSHPARRVLGRLHRSPRPPPVDWRPVPRHDGREPRPVGSRSTRARAPAGPSTAASATGRRWNRSGTASAARAPAAT